MELDGDPYVADVTKQDIGKGTYREGVTPFRTGKCSNQTGHLGFTCPIDYEKSSWVIGHTQIDHVDGNHLNNTAENCQELCDICQQRKR